MAEEQLNPGTLTAVRKVRGTRAQAIAYIRNGESGDLPINRTMAGRFVQVFNGWQSVMCDDGELTVSQVEAEAASWAPVKPVFPERRETLGDRALAVLAELVEWDRRLGGWEAPEWVRARALLAEKAKGEAA